MEDSKMRSLDKRALEGAVRELNPHFINGLPKSPEEIFEFAKRRSNPEISDNISYNLGKMMLEYRLSDKDYFITLLKVIYDVFYDKEPAKTVPQAQILVSQTGAGKTKLREMLLKDCPNIAIINSDLYKKFRPDADEIMKKDPTHFGALTGIDCYDHANNVTEFATRMKYNILTECAPSIKGGLIGVDLEKLKNMNYDVQFQVMAVGDMVSALAIHYRYEIDLINKQPGAKLTDLKRHDESYEAVAQSIKKLNPNYVNIYRRGTIKEGQIPINISDGIQNKNVVNLLQILNRERNNSNYQYYESGQLKSDYETIKDLMNERNAPIEQKAQLGQVYEKCILGREKLKFLGNESR